MRKSALLLLSLSEAVLTPASAFCPAPASAHVAGALRPHRVLRGGSGRVAPEGVRSLSGDSSTTSREETMVQYVLVRRDLQADLGWPIGSVIAQGCHAVSKLLWELKEHENVISYCSDIDSMHKVVLGVKNSNELLKFAKKLEDAGMLHRVWVEQPENDATALAVLPYPRAEIQPFLKKLPLLK